MTLRVFVGEPSRLTSAQRFLSDGWHLRLLEAGCCASAVRREDYESDPWRGLRRRLHEADGALILGFAQLAIHRGTWRPATDEQVDVAAGWTSPWLQVEVGMAVALDLPVLVAVESVVAEGAFSPGVWAGNLYGTSLEAPGEHVLQEWFAAVAARHRSLVDGSPSVAPVTARSSHADC